MRAKLCFTLDLEILTVEMRAVNIKAHYDGERILLDEPFEIPPNSPLLVTVLPATQEVVGEDWIVAAENALSRAYGQDEPEYTTADVRHR